MRPRAALIAAALAACAAGAALAQAGPDDGPDITLSGDDGMDWLVACEGETIHGERFTGRIGGPRRAPATERTFREVGYLRCRIQAGPGASLRLSLVKEGGEPFCPLTGGQGPGPCEARFGPMESATFEFEAVP